MRKVLLAFSALVGFAAASFAQVCAPDPAYTALGVGVYPLPDTFETGGVLAMDPGAGFNGRPAQVGCPYEFIFTAVVPTSIPAFGTTVGLNHVDVKQIKFYAPFAQGQTPNTATLIDLGLDSVAVPANFRFVGGTEGCLKLEGTIRTAVAPGDYDAEITVDISTQLGPLNNNHFPARPGEITNQLSTGRGRYRITILPAGTCSVSTMEAGDLSIAQNSPNPFSTSTNIEFSSLSTGLVDFQVNDIMGQVIDVRQQLVNVGGNFITVDGTNLASGVYFYSITKDGSKVTGKMVVAH